MPLKPRPQRKGKKGQQKDVPPPSYLPRLKALPRELMPLISKTQLKENLDNEFVQFRNINEHLPCLKKLNKSDEIQNLTSPITHLTISGESDTYFLDVNAKMGEMEKTLALFVKRVHLVEPIQAMEGEYCFPTDGALPRDEKAWQNTLAKIHSPYNEAYIDTLCAATLSRLVELEKSPHWIRFYGTFNSRVQTYLYNITGEISSLRNERWFKKNEEGGFFRIRVTGEEHGNRPTVAVVEEEEAELECDQLDNEELSDRPSRASSLKSDDCRSENPSTDDEAEVEHVADPPVRIVKLAEEGENSISEDDETGSEDSEESDESNDSIQNQCEYYAEFDDFPVQVTLLERCEGTMDALLDVEELTTDETMISTKDARWSAWIFQVISALTVAQYYYGFVHNDLHTNNIMWCSTTETHLYYKLDGPDVKYYKVPTYGRLMKIIDFGRASFWLSDRNDLLITDSYAPGNDAADQYNCPPYFDESEPRVDPNPSFDLCRLAVSMFDALYPEQPPIKDPAVVMSQEEGRVSLETESPLYNLLWRWLTDDEGMSIMRNPDDSERFPDFDLYKHIARHAKSAVPREEALSELFAGYSVTRETFPDGTKIWEIPLQ